MPGLYNLLRQPSVACSSELGQIWRPPDADLGELVAWEPTTFLEPIRITRQPARQ